ncbi:uncharacterized protein LOC134182991 [Corticium candelabrum]|uniref:uncharacterized protein LOC134182991 n=1 Tax=Corticium candelabrum TaxID=121492 RepID=UPI002E26DB4B|nr:uncharacterized protein LOC134182991 [Corticium candelabrum]
MSSHSEYDRYITRNMTKLVQGLRTSELIDDLVSEGLASLEDGRKLSKCETEQERARLLLYHVLPYKGDNVVDRFCKVLKAAGHVDIVTDVMGRGVVSTDQADQPAQQQQPVQQSQSNQQSDEIKQKENSATESMQEERMTASAKDTFMKEGEEPIQEEVGNTSRSTVEATASSLEEMDSQWEEQLKHCSADVIAALRPTLLLDHLRAFKLLSPDEHRELQQMPSEAERSERLVSTILPQKGKGSFNTFCHILCCVEKQNHIVSKILKVHNVSLSPIHVEKISHPDSYEPPRKKQHVEGFTDLGSTSSQPRELCDHERNRSATLYFKKKDEETVKPFEARIKELCQACFKIPQDRVLFFYTLPPAGQRVIFYGDSVYKPAVLHLDQVSPDLVEKEKSRLVSFVANLIQVTKDGIYFTEVVKSSCLVLFQMRLDVYLRLFSALTMEAQCIAFHQSLKQTFPELVVAKFRLGGLPPIEVISTERILKEEGSATKMLQINQMTMSSLSAIALPLKRLKKQVNGLFEVVDGLTDDLMSHDRQVKIVLDATNASKQNTVVLDELVNNRIDCAVQIKTDQKSIAACFTRMKVREDSSTKDVYDNLDVIKGFQENIEMKLSQRPQLAQLTSYSHTLIEGLGTRVANLKLARKKAKTDPVVKWSIGVFQDDSMAAKDDAVKVCIY